MSDAHDSIILVSIFDGTQYLERRACHRVRLSTGEGGVLYQGLAYPLHAGDRIDLSGLAHVPDTTAGPPAGASFVFAEGGETAYLFVTGSVADREAAAEAIRAAGGAVIRSGPYLGDAPDNGAPDWFIRFETKGLPAERFTRSFSASPGMQASTDAANHPSALRLQLLRTDLTNARDRIAFLEAKIDLLTSQQTEAGHSPDEAAQNAEESIDAESLTLAQWYAALPASPAVETGHYKRTSPVAAHRRVQAEVETVLDTFLPGIRLLRDSLSVIAIEYADRRAIYRVLKQLDPTVRRFTGNWKKVHTLDGWWESHVSDGQSSSGRVYARFDPASRVFNVLASQKGDQDRDIAWLSRQP